MSANHAGAGAGVSVEGKQAQVQAQAQADGAAEKGLSPAPRGDIPSVHFREEYRLVAQLSAREGVRVFEAVRRGDPSPQRLIVKVFPKSQRDATAMFWKEHSALLALSDVPNVIPHVRSVQDHNFWYLLSHRASTDLLEWTRRTKVKERQARHVLRSVLAAVAELHRRGLAHRDLKLENAVLDRKGRVWLIDFSDCLQVDEEAVYTWMVGTLPYLAPERWRDHRGWEVFASDVWAVGVMAFAMMTRRACFSEESPEALREAILKGKWSFPESVELSDDFKDLVGQMLTLRAEDRPTAEQCLQHRWFADKQR